LALRGQRISLLVSELALFRRGDELLQVSLVNVTEPKARFDEMIAGVKIAVVLQRRAVTARRRVNAQQMAAEIRLKRHLEELNINAAYVMTYPLLEDIHQEAAVLFTSD
jgi:hypothetical protein